MDNRKCFFCFFIYFCFELIETLWNVNTVMSGRKSTEVSELIETLWNVNFNKSIILSDGFMN